LRTKAHEVANDGMDRDEETASQASTRETVKGGGRAKQKVTLKAA
jgi:hypothetical protein